MSRQTELQLQNGAARSLRRPLRTARPIPGALLNSMIAVARNREDAEDITATAFAVAFKNLDCFRASHRSLPGFTRSPE